MLESIIARIAKEAGETYTEAWRQDPKQKEEKRPVGRPAQVCGKGIQVYLDAERLEIAARLSAGNKSKGLRKALKIANLYHLTNEEKTQTIFIFIVMSHKYLYRWIIAGNLVHLAL